MHRDKTTGKRNDESEPGVPYVDHESRQVPEEYESEEDFRESCRKARGVLPGFVPPQYDPQSAAFTDTDKSVLRAVYPTDEMKQLELRYLAEIERHTDIADAVDGHIDQHIQASVVAFLNETGAKKMADKLNEIEF